jgi:hypothetical protein
MSRLDVPLRHRVLFATGSVLLGAELDLLLKDNTDRWRQETFLVDSGTEMTTMPASLAKQLDLPIPQQAAPGVIHAQTGLEIRSGSLRARVVGMDQTEYVFPCFFLGDPTTTASSSPSKATPRKLLGLSGFIDQLRLIFDGTPTPTAPYGALIVEKV